MIDFSREFITENLILRPIRISDLNEMYLNTQNSEMWTYFTSDLSNVGELKKWIESGISEKNRLALTILNKETKEIIGSTSIGNISIKDKRVEIGWTWISEKYQGTGLNREVKISLINYLFEECNLERVEFKTDVLNLAARKALNNIGLIEEGVLRSHTLMIKNRRRDTIFYSVLKNEWKGIKERLKDHSKT